MAVVVLFRGVLSVQGQCVDITIRGVAELSRVVQITAARNFNCHLTANAALSVDCALNTTGAAFFHQMLNINCVLKVNGETRGRSGTSGATW